MTEQTRTQWAIERTHGLGALKLGQVWGYRELLYFLVWRDLKVRYRQTLLGISWIVLQPLVATSIFAVIFGALIRVPSDGLPYPLFAFAALLPWNYFASSLNHAGTSLVTNSELITKIYFPRLILPLSGILNTLFDFAISFVVLLLLMAYYGIVPGITVLALPFFLLLAIGTALGMSLWLSALHVRYRDVNHFLPFLIQMWLYATPVVYPASIVPEPWRGLLGLNPMASVVEGFRWSLTGKGGVSGEMLLLSTTVTTLLLVSGVLFFSTTERTFADVI